MNTPNKLTLLRVILIPFFVVFMLTPLGGTAGKWIALGIFVIASLTDTLDGYLARRDNLVTNFGKFMDPLADKLLVCSAMICLVEMDRLPAWIVIIIIGREFIISGFRHGYDHSSDCRSGRRICSCRADIHLSCTGSDGRIAD